jgi:integrase
MIIVFMKWHGELMDDFKVKVPKSMPPYTENSDVEKLFSAIQNKKTHKGCVTRDSLLVELALKTGMRRSELANLEPKDIHSDFLSGDKRERRQRPAYTASSRYRSKAAKLHRGYET